MKVPRSVKTWISKYPRMANFLKSKYDAFFELTSSRYLPNVVIKRRASMIEELSAIPMQSLVITDATTTLTLKDGTQFFMRPSPSTSTILLYDGTYEAKEMELMMGNVKGVVFDIGANFGWYTVHFSKHADKVYAFEPITYDELQENIALNNCKNVVAVNKAIGDAQRETAFFIPKIFRGSGSASEHNYYGSKVNVSMITLDDYVEEHNIQRVDFIKADIEGGELGMLKGAEKTLRKFHPAMSLEIEEWHTSRFGYQPEDIFSFLKHLGYSQGIKRSDMFYFTAHLS
jgi:FkbM family methyltransferase